MHLDFIIMTNKEPQYQTTELLQIAKGNFNEL